MKYFWLLKPTIDGNKFISWDCNVGFVVKAANAKEARKVVMDSLTHIYDDGEVRYYGDESRYAKEPFWLNPKLATCVRLREAGTSQVILSSFRAG